MWLVLVLWLHMLVFGALSSLGSSIVFYSRLLLLVLASIYNRCSLLSPAYYSLLWTGWNSNCCGNVAASDGNHADSINCWRPYGSELNWCDDKFIAFEVEVCLKTAELCGPAEYQNRFWFWSSCRPEGQVKAPLCGRKIRKSAIIEEAFYFFEDLKPPLNMGE